MTDAPLRFAPTLDRLDDRTVPTVLYYGGNLLPHVEAQAVYLGAGWSQAGTSTAAVDASLGDLVGGAYMDALTRAGYGVGRGTATAGVVDSTPYAANALVTDASIRQELQADITAGRVATPDANRLYVLYVQPNVAVNLGAGQGTTQQGILGYHGAFGGRDAAGHAATIRYAVVAYPGGTVGNSSMGGVAVDQLTSVASHEVAEAVTDPDVNYGRLGWYDPRRGEIGDVTENNPAAFVRLDGYLVQEVADRNDQLLAINLSPPPPPPPTTPTPPATQTGTTTTLTAGPVTYHGRFRPATVNLTVTISPASGTAIPGGTVELVYNGQVLGTGAVRVVNGVAQVSFTVQFSASGTYSFSAVYVGNSAFAGSTSNTVTVQV